MDDYNDLIEFAITAVALLVIVSLAIVIAKSFARSNVVGGIVGFAVFLIAILLLGMGAIDTPLTNWASEGISNLIAPNQVATAVNPTTINLQVDVPPATVIVEKESTLGPVVEMGDGDMGSVSEDFETDTSSIFNLGSITPDGRFEDNVPYFIYEIQSGDTIYNIRNRFGLSEAELLDRNDLDIRRPIIIGQDLKITILD